eukprot:jgi/Astpho2/1509/fgenesh1_pg.00026_%23_20_t
MGENHLKRETPFQCQIRFFNTLPEVPADPKMMLPDLDEQELAAFKLTSLERNPRHTLMLDPMRCCPVSMMDMERWCHPGGPQQLAPEDRELLGDDAAALTASSPLPGAAPGRAGVRGARDQLSWLIRTTYISTDSKATNQKERGMTEKDVKRLEAALEEEQEMADDPEALLDSIEVGWLEFLESSFKAAQRPPVHPTKPHLKPVQVLPVLPDEDGRVMNFVNMAFDDDPMTDHPMLTQMPPKKRQKAAESSYMKSYVVQTDAGKGQSKMVAFLVPKDDPDEAGPSSRDAEERDYEWIREYIYDIKTEEHKRTFVLHLRPEYTGYLTLDTRLNLQKRGKQLKRLGKRARNDEFAFLRPSKITIRHEAAGGGQPAAAGTNGAAAESPEATE